MCSGIAGSAPGSGKIEMGSGEGDSPDEMGFPGREKVTIGEEKYSK